MESGKEKNRKRCVIIGGGTSINEGLKSGVQEKIFDEIKFVCNYAYRYFDPDFLTFVDFSWYNKEKQIVKKFPCVVTKDHKRMTADMMGMPNIFILPSTKIYYGKDALKKGKGIYTPTLCGIFSLTLAIALGFDEIFLLGMDFGNPDINKNDKTHFYQDKFNHRGVGVIKDRGGRKRYATGIYKNKAIKYYNVYERDIKRLGVNIWNVSPQSKIEIFPKISYGDFYKKISETPPEPKEEIIEECKLKMEVVRTNGIKYANPL